MESTPNCKQDPHPRKCEIHQRLIIYICLTFGKEYCVTCMKELKDSKDIVGIEDFCEEKVKGWKDMYAIFTDLMKKKENTSNEHMDFGT